MIDTVRLVGDYNIPDQYLYHGEWTESPYFRKDGTQGEKFRFQKKGELMWLQYDAGLHQLTVEVSIPKFMYGHNCRLITDYDLQLFLNNRLNDYLMTRFKAVPRHKSEYLKVLRMDVCWNFQVGGEVRDYIKAYSQIYLSRYNTNVWGDGETVIWKNKSKRMSFYNKEIEVEGRQSGEEEIALSQGVLRFEVNIKNSKILSRYSDQRWAGDLLNSKVAKRILSDHLSIIGIDKHNTISNELEIARKLRDEFGEIKTQQLLGFIHYIRLFGDEGIRHTSKSTYDRRMKDLRSLGITPILTERDLNPLDLSEIMDVEASSMENSS